MRKTFGPTSNNDWEYEIRKNDGLENIYGETTTVKLRISRINWIGACVEIRRNN